ncbi:MULTISPECIES: ribbon-helix-helix domain-containing protein [unclassified Duganella]|uniref:ribbon-helix-helix domain-containing protein n=1 Tax=unclassified Duganella TaxID=2636909 RepID=UPI0009F6F691|nr:MULTISPECIES: ribbon-helix-helix domain-containing protein [unclassified Duganella]
MQRRWNIAVSSATDQALRVFLAARGGGRKGDLSKFVEEAVTTHIKNLSGIDSQSAGERTDAPGKAKRHKR